MQTRTKSLIEQLANTVAGFIISIILVKFFFPEISLAKNTYITLVFTVVSIVRGYVIRRIFNRI